MKTIDEDIKSGNFRPVYLLYGEEAYLKLQYKNKLVKALTQDGDTMNFSTYTGKDINVKEVIDLAETMPFLAERRVILIEDSGYFKNAAEDLAEYMTAIPETTFFVFVESEVDKRNKLFKTVQKQGVAISFETQSEQTLTKWIMGRIKRENKNISNQAFQAFLEKTGSDMENIDKELEKLLCYTMQKDSIELTDVEMITTEQITNKIFEMVDSIALHNQKKALDLYYDLVALKEPSMRIMYMITRQFNILLTVKTMSGHGFSNKEVAAKAGCPEFAVRKNLGQCKNFSVAQLKEAIRDGVELEEAIKTGRMNDQMAVELFIVKYSRA